MDNSDIVEQSYQSVRGIDKNLSATYFSTELALPLVQWAGIVPLSINGFLVLL